MSKYRIRIQDLDGTKRDAKVTRRGVLTKRVVKNNKVYLFSKRDTDRVPLFVQQSFVWRVK